MVRRLAFAIAFFLAVLTIGAVHGGGEEPRGRPSLGGMQFWTDHVLWRGYRIQQNALSKHWRLVRPNNRVVVSGDRTKCRQVMQRLIAVDELECIQRPVVITLHGLGRTRRSMEDLGAHLEHAGFHWENFGYASTRRSVDDHAAALVDVVDRMGQMQRDAGGELPITIHFVGHSLGSVVVRRFYAMRAEQGDAAARRAWRPGRIVMLGPPNRGSGMARLFRSVPLFRTLAGAPGQQLGRQWRQTEPKLAVPPGQFGIIAGGRGDGRGFNPLLDGDDDGVVAVVETRLAGAADFRVVPALHTFLMSQPEVMQMTRTFLQKGHFEARDRRQPIPADDTGESPREARSAN